jgi:hypothetical protein
MASVDRLLHRVMEHMQPDRSGAEVAVAHGSTREALPPKAMTQCSHPPSVVPINATDTAKAPRE